MSKQQRKQSPTQPLHGYPRPQLQRKDWTSLDGEWAFAIDVEGAIEDAADVGFDRTITVPFAPETPVSGIGETGFFQACWYRREFASPQLRPDERLILRFEAVDYRATVWVNDKLAVRHEGGYTPFAADVTDLLTPAQSQVIVVRAQDNPHDLSQPRGKQDWKLQPHSIWYPRTTGIWQTVWLERVNRSHFSRLRWQADASRWEINLHARVHSPMEALLRLRVRLQSRGPPGPGH
jgi:beta-galactosidase/beta-glucuronidase